MNTPKKIPTLAILSLLTSLLLVTSLAYAATSWVNGQAADLVLGQASFTTNTPGTTLSQMNNPAGVAIDPMTHKVFVTDYTNCRVLRFASTTTLTNGAAAEFQFGSSCGTSQTTLSQPTGLFVDNGGRLWVADEGNHRILRFDNAATTISSAASGVLGQANYVTGTPNRGATVNINTMKNPIGVWGDSVGRLWVADQFNYLVLRFDNTAGKADGANADAVLGQSNFTSSTPATSQSGFNRPVGVMVDSLGRLYVADYVNQRVLRFDNAAGKADGANADGVLGQSNFTSNTPATSQSGMGQPIGLAVDPIGRLYVSDRDTNNRVLIWDNAATLSNGAPANYVLGQTNFTANIPGTSATTLNFPSLIYFGEGTLWVPDTLNNRVLRFLAPATPVGGVAQSFDLMPTSPPQGLIAFSAMLLGLSIVLGRAKR